MADILKAVADSRAVGQKGWTEDDVRYAISFTIRTRDAEWRAAVERARGTIPREPDEFERALAAIGDAVLNNVLAAMEAK